VVHNRMQGIRDVGGVLDFAMHIDEPYHVALSRSHVRYLCPPWMVLERHGSQQEATRVNRDTLTSVVAVRLPADTWTVVVVDIRRQIGGRVSAFLQEDNVSGQ